MIPAITQDRRERRVVAGGLDQALGYAVLELVLEVGE